MPRYKYQVVPFIGMIKSGESAVVVSKHLQEQIQKFADAGWEFCTLNDVNIEVQPGCIQGLLGQKASYIQYDQIVFRREE